jgi:hypothetical protein
MLRDEGGPWYPIAAVHPVRHANRLIAMSGAGWSIIGKVMRDPDSKRPCWFELRGRKVVRLGPWRPIEEGESRWWEPEAFRPLPGQDWPDNLPKPLRAHRYPDLPPPEEPVPPPVPENDGWPYPGLRLGCQEPPTSEQETEARVLRALRTMHSQPRVGVKSDNGSWPTEWYLIMRRIEDHARDDNAIGDVRIAWSPTRRDATDWDYAMSWLTQANREDYALISMRGANPSFSWRRIAELEKVSPQAIHQRYRTAIGRLYAIATGEVAA